MLLLGVGQSGMEQAEIKRGWLPIPTFSHREPPFCMAAKNYLFLAPFFAAAFLAGAFLAGAFFAAAFFAVAIAFASPFVRFFSTQDNVLFHLLCTNTNNIQYVVVSIYFASRCQLFFLQIYSSNSSF
jgi:hypothetical protein